MTMTAISATTPTPSADDPIIATDADRALKQKHARMWASGDYSRVADELVGSLGGVLVEAVGVTAGQQVLDIAAGTGTSAVPAARRGAQVTATDLTPELLAIGAARVEGEPLDLTWQTADAENLPFAAESFDVALSAIGIMFAPHHELAAAEIVRVVRPGGTIGVLSWTPEGFIGQMFAAMKPYAPPPPAGATPPPRWGHVDHVRGLFGDRVRDLVARQRVLRVDHFASGAEFRDYFKSNYGPAISTYAYNAGDPAAAAGLDDALVALFDRFDTGGGVLQWEYLLVTATRV